MKFLKPHHLRLSSTSNSDTRAAGNKSPSVKASRTSTASSGSRYSSSSASTSQPKIKSKIKSKFIVQNLRSLFIRHGNANGDHSTSASNSTSVSISSTPLNTRASHPIARLRDNHGPSISPPASPAAAEVSNSNREAARTTSPSDAEMMFFLASQHEENLTKQHLQELVEVLGADTPVVDTNSEVEDDNALAYAGRWYRRQPDQDLRPGHDVQSREVQKTGTEMDQEKPLPALPERSLNRKDPSVRDKSYLQYRYSNSSVDSDIDREDTLRSRRTYSGISGLISPALSTKPLLSPLLNKPPASPLVPPSRSSYKRHQKSSSASGKISGYLGNGADLFDQTRKELQSSLGSTMDLFWRERLIDDSDSDESFFCIGEGQNGPGRTKAGKTLEELDRERRLSGKGHDPWTEGLLRECRRCEGPNPRGLKGLCIRCEFDIKGSRPQSYDGSQETHGTESISMYEAKKRRSMHLKVSEMTMGDRVPNQIDSRSQRRPDHTMKAIKSFIDHAVVLKSPRHDSHFGIIQDEDGSPVSKLTESSSVRSVRSEPGIRASLFSEQPSELQRRSSQSMRLNRNSSIRPSLDSSTVQIAQYVGKQESRISRSSRNMFDQWQTSEMRAQYKKQEQDYERWSLTLLEGDSTVQPVPPKSKFREPNYSADGYNNEMKPELKVAEKQGMGRWKGKEVDRSDVLSEFQDDAVRF